MVLSGDGVATGQNGRGGVVHQRSRAGQTGAGHAGADLYGAGNGVRQDLARAAAWFTRAAEQDDTTAQLNLGLMYQSGSGVPADILAAVRWYTKAAEGEFLQAQ